MKKTTTAFSLPRVFLPFLLLTLALLITSHADAQPVYWSPDTLVSPLQRDFRLPVYVSAGSCPSRDLTIEVEFIASTFFPHSVTRGTIIRNDLVGDNRIIGISFNGLPDLPHGTLTQIVGDVLLGEVQTTGTIIRAFCNNVPVTDSINSGYLALDFCEEGGDRYILYGEGFGITKIVPNPTRGNVTVALSTLEETLTYLEVYSPLGARIYAASWVPSRNEKGEMIKEVNLPEDLASGLYRVVLRAPGRSATQPLIIAK